MKGDNMSHGKTRMLAAAASLIVLLASVSVATCDTSSGVRHSGIATKAGEAALILVGDGVEPAPIISTAKSGLTKRAADELAKYLSRISGAKFTTTIAGEEIPARAVIVGKIEGMKLPEGIGDEGFVIRTEGKRLYLCGSTPHSTMYGVFSLLEEHHGARIHAG